MFPHAAMHVSLVVWIRITFSGRTCTLDLFLHGVYGVFKWMHSSLLHITMYIDSTMLGCIHVSVLASKCPARDATPQCPFDQFDDVGVLGIGEVDLGILQCTFHVVRRDLLLRKVVRQVGKHPADVERTRLVCVPDVYHLHHPIACSRRRVRATWFLLRHVVQPLSILVLPLWIGYVGCLTARES